MTERDAHDPTVVPGIAHEPGPRRAPGSRRRKRRGSGCLPILVVLVIVGALGYVGVTRGIDFVQDKLGGAAEDYPGPGSGRVVFEVQEGDSVAEVGRNLKTAEVVASVDAFTEAVAGSALNPQVGVFVLKKEMKAVDALEVLANRANDKSVRLTLLPGKTVDEIVTLLGKDTEFGRKAYAKQLENPEALGLPDYAEGDLEGFLAPGAYVFGPDDTPRTILAAMVTRFVTEADAAGLEAGAEKLGYTPLEVLTVASMLQVEGHENDREKISRVIYNRLEIDGNPSGGFLQVDATVNYALGRKVTRLTLDEIDSVADSPYNTYTNQGLPPGPIATVSAGALEAALKPADGPWFFYVTVNLKTGLTKFTDDPDEFQRFKAQLDEYCDTQSDRC
jgi:UPF0755 protein